ncbi:hypothetical protein [Falsibacillus pallidus]|uniref:Uncharacterized protein n=1 Tax=Falsibacillus pallidus TaxID=493781 RepID=A0A370G891_9BACI|nr:hypothetical protein [Falsibacillus pallidus]RDI40001.1 hypothetical protein DFR59_11324 [Falsibacillus pallidus]
MKVILHNRKRFKNSQAESIVEITNTDDLNVFLLDTRGFNGTVAVDGHNEGVQKLLIEADEVYLPSTMVKQYGEFLNEEKCFLYFEMEVHPPSARFIELLNAENQNRRGVFRMKRSSDSGLNKEAMLSDVFVFSKLFGEVSSVFLKKSVRERHCYLISCVTFQKDVMAHFEYLASDASEDSLEMEWSGQGANLDYSSDKSEPDYLIDVVSLQEKSYSLKSQIAQEYLSFSSEERWSGEEVK